MQAVLGMSFKTDDSSKFPADTCLDSGGGASVVFSVSDSVEPDPLYFSTASFDSSSSCVAGSSQALVVLSGQSDDCFHSSDGTSSSVACHGDVYSMYTYSDAACSVGAQFAGNLTVATTCSDQYGNFRCFCPASVSVTRKAVMGARDAHAVSSAKGVEHTLSSRWNLPNGVNDFMRAMAGGSELLPQSLATATAHLKPASSSGTAGKRVGRRKGESSLRSLMSKSPKVYGGDGSGWSRFITVSDLTDTLSWGFATVYHYDTTDSCAYGGIGGNMA